MYKECTQQLILGRWWCRAVYRRYSAALRHRLPANKDQSLCQCLKAQNRSWKWLCDLSLFFFLKITVYVAGLGDMAVSNTIGSNVFDILVGLGVPWAIQTMAVSYGSEASLSYKNPDIIAGVFLSIWRQTKSHLCPPIRWWSTAGGWCTQWCFCWALWHLRYEFVLLNW